MYFTSGSDRAFEQLMQTRPGADHFDNGEAGAPEDCGTCRFYRPHWKYQFCVYEECPYQPGKLTALDGAVKFQVKGVDDEMAVFRVEKNRGYTVMSNHHLRNKDLSLKAKGLLSQMLSLPEDWDFTLKGLSLINREQIDAIRAAVRELEQAGYIVRSRERDSQGRLRGADYIIYEQSQPVPDSPTLENPTLDIPTQEKPTQLNKDRSSKEKSITDGSNTDSIPILFQFCFPALPLFLCVPLGVGLSFVLAGLYHRQAVFLAQPVAGAPDIGVALAVGNVLALFRHIYGAENDVVVQVAFVDVGGNHIGIFALQHFIGKLPPDLMGLLRRGFPRFEGLYQVMGQIVALLVRLIQQHLKFNIRRFIGRNEQLFIGLVRVLDVIQRLFQR